MCRRGREHHSRRGIQIKAPNRYSPSYLASLEVSLGLFAVYTEAQEWPPADAITTAYVEEYLGHLQDRPRWFGERDRSRRPLSQSYIETQYRRIKRFFGWMRERQHIAANPLDLIPHPHIDERVIPDVSQRDLGNLLKLTDPAIGRTAGKRFRQIRNRAAPYLLIDTPGRRDEIADIRVDGVDLDEGIVRIMGKGRLNR